jgi:CxxC motif-containing protein (DUF1111 family)
MTCPRILCLWLASVCAVPLLPAQERAPQALQPSATVDVGDDLANAFGYPSPLLGAADRRAFVVGNALFKQNWVTAPSSTPGLDGLGPLFHARSCSACHFRDGRSRPPEGDERERHGLLLRIGVRQDHGPDLPHPVYGGQLQEQALPGLAPEVRVESHWQEVGGSFGDGEPYTLVSPTYTLSELGYGPLGPGVVLGARTAPHLIGLGLLEAVPDAVLQRLADPDDRDRDGISGRVHEVLDVATGRSAIGRFGWKATQPTVLAQAAAAFVNDMGITSKYFPHEVLTAPQRQALGVGDPGAPEIDAHQLERVVFYTRALAVPARRGVGLPEVQAGERLFASYGCAACHLPELTTGDVAFHPSHRGVRFAPYTDLLLHDLGQELADGKRDGAATPAEWRTAPLWGLGLLRSVNGHERLLHDGRARRFAEAVLWHGGEALAARERFRTAPRAEREALLAFLRSL